MLAHASGFNWDEGLMVLAPIAFVGALLNWARKREAHAASAHTATRNQR
jgi:hypothetical protein